ncbi:imidazole glycerol phosphate synthase subunit HisH [Salinisphaera sp.]|uniref:imidazole glycerol phosphate synthase subunit HisH n=1 Tax=Salinisphaera sp. TaxID=1914330 RepID=UPI002D78E246|nr:imidazole glycerol phosphate synthase subunit HisH [Salinisphaera sp.]HET7314793.1 imidazole glycerol phosphate synthase subunit HisH [Salinisphaera sp.]
MATVGIIDYGMGNLHSITKALRYVASDEQIEVSFDPDALARMDRLVLPGVGAIGHCMDELQRLELDDMLHSVLGVKPLMGVCLGIEALMAHSEESGGVECLGAFPGDTVKFADPETGADGSRRKIPHMGWNQVRQERHHPLWKNIASDSWFYFVHSYYVVPDDPGHIAGTTDYGARFASMVLRENVFAVQFHPEKSQSAGLQLLANFLEWNGGA